MLRENEIINGTYQIIREIGSGGMGVIYLAYHINLQKYVVIKRIKDDFVGNINGRSEADIMKNLRHSYIPQIYDFLQFDSDIYTVMNYIEGYDFKQYLDANYEFSEEDIIKWLSQCLEVLDYLHGQNPPIIHSDIKPANIMLDNNGNICLIDFNISFEQDKGKPIGATAAYAPIEQMVEQDVYDPYEGYKKAVITDARTDIYSLGASFYHLVTHIKPNIDINDIYPIISLDIPYSDYLKKIIYKAMQKNPEDRYSSAKEMLNDVKNIRKHSKEYKLKRLAIIAIALLGGMVIGLGGVSGYKKVKENKLEKFEKKYNYVIALSSDNYPEDVIDESLDLLNDEENSKYFEEYIDKKGNLLYQIANAYYAKKEYENANEYYKQALDYTDDSNVYRDYAVSLVKAGKLDAAHELIDNYGYYLNEMDSKQINAELSFEEENYDQAIRDFEYIIDNSFDEDLKIRTTVLLSEAYYKIERYEDMVNLLEKGTLSGEYEVSKNRLLSIAYIGLANNSEGNDKIKYYEDAESCLSYLKINNYMSFEEKLNLVIVYQNTGRFNNASGVLSELMSEYPNDYRIYVQKCFLIYNEQAQKSSSERRYDEFENYYIKTIDLYNEQNTSGIDNEKIVQLKNIHQELKDKGLL